MIHPSQTENDLREATQADQYPSTRERYFRYVITPAEALYNGYILTDRRKARIEYFETAAEALEHIEREQTNG